MGGYYGFSGGIGHGVRELGRKMLIPIRSVFYSYVWFGNVWYCDKGYSIRYAVGERRLSGKESLERDEFFFVFVGVDEQVEIAFVCIFIVLIMRTVLFVGFTILLQEI